MERSRHQKPSTLSPSHLKHEIPYWRNSSHLCAHKGGTYGERTCTTVIQQGVIWSQTSFFLIEHSTLTTSKTDKNRHRQQATRDQLGVRRNEDANLKCLVLIPLQLYFARNIRHREFSLSHYNSLRVFISGLTPVPCRADPAS
jgi:hypothetical protein